MNRLIIFIATATMALAACGQNGQNGQSETNEQREEAYRAEMEQYDLEGEAIINAYRALVKADPKGVQPATKKKVLQFSEQIDSLSDLQLKLIRRIIRENKNNQIPVPYIREAMEDLGYEGLKEALDPQTAYYNNPHLQKAKALFASYEKRKPGTKFYDMTMQNLEGETVKLSQWAGRGNYVLIEFWASWCIPCLRETPNLKACYRKYKDKGFQIVGVSLDDDRAAWNAAVKRFGLQWPQMSDLKKWQTIARPTYGIQSIPANVLVDPQGTIIAVNLRDYVLRNKLKEIYGK